MSERQSVHAAGATLTSRRCGGAGIGSAADAGPDRTRRRVNAEEIERMEIVVEPGRLPERGTLVVPVGHDGTLGAAAARASIGRRAACVRAGAGGRGGELKHGRAVDLLLPPGLSLDRLVLLVARQAATA